MKPLILRKRGREKMDSFECVFCKSAEKFQPFGRGFMERPFGLCKFCQSLDRHRFFKIVFDDHLGKDFGRNKSILHVAPETKVAEMFKEKTSSYVASVFPARNNLCKDEIVLDVTQPDESLFEKFDIIFASHILEHIPDDKRALNMMKKMLKPSKESCLIVMIPQRFDQNTHENDPQVETDADRLKFYGQEDHVRYPGADYIDRIKEAGFEIDVFCVQSAYRILKTSPISKVSRNITSCVDLDKERHYGLLTRDIVYVCYVN